MLAKEVQMNKISLIIKREYLTRVKKKSFVIMTLLGPLLMAAMMIVPIWIGMKDQDFQIIEVVDETGLFINQFENTKTLKFEHQFVNIEVAKDSFYNSKYTSILHITGIGKQSTAKMYYKKQPGLNTISKIESTIEDGIRNIELKEQFNISKEQLEQINPTVHVETIFRNVEGGEETKSSTISSVLGFGGAIIIYMFIFLYGVQVMRGVIEEKTSRIVEIIISSVKPFQLMLGKIVGIALVGLTQFLLWIILTGIIISIAQVVLNQDVEMVNQGAIQQVMKTQGAENIETTNVSAQIQSVIDEIPVVTLLISFLFYFLGGYLLYGALFAAIGSAVDSEADTQQFMMPITIPLIFAFVVAQTVIQNPDGSLAFWLSLFPLTSPIIMMVRIPFGVETWELLLSMFLLVLGFIGTTWVAGRIYRTGILMYGKKVNYKELWKWLFYKG